MHQYFHFSLFSFFLAITLCVLGASPARAACVNPAGVAGDVVWVSAYNRPAYCNDTTWTSFPRGGAHSWGNVVQNVGLNNPFPNADDSFAQAVSMSGDLVVVGVPDDNGGAVASGRAFVFNVITGELVSTLTHPAPGSYDYFGQAVGLSGNLAIVGAFAASPGGLSEAGTAYIFNATTGALITELINPSSSADDHFGEDVAISGNLAIVGAHAESTDASNGGRAYVYNATTGALITTLVSPSPAADDGFGWAVAIDGNVAAVSAYYYSGGGVIAAGRVYIFNATTGALLHTIDNPDPFAYDYFGNALAMSGHLVVIGLEDDVGATNAGGAYVYSAATGNLVSTLANPAPAASDFFGHGLDVFGSHVIIGADRDNPGGVNDAGTAYIFNAMTGALLATLSNPSPTAGDRFGYGVTISDRVAVVGAYADDPGGVSNTGAAYVFTARMGTACVNPAGVAGDVLYNATSHQLQYCDGDAWYAAGPAGNGGAGCINPSGSEGDIAYNSTSNVLQYCEGDAWIGIGRNEPPYVPTGCPNIGDICGDGSIYAGLTPDGGIKMYAAAADSPTQMVWASGVDLDTAMVNCTNGAQVSCDTGQANTTYLATLSNAASPYLAAQYCDGLTAHGRSDWYLPAMNELSLLYTNLYLSGIGGFSAVDYWTSSEYGDDSVKDQYFGDGNNYNTGKSNNFYARCVRK